MKNDGGAAFPTFERRAESTTYQPYGGMTLRDYMAGQALVGLIDKFYYNSNLYQAQEPALAEKAYFIADAMIKARGE